MIYHNDNYFSDVEELLEYLDIEKGDNLPEATAISYRECRLKPMFQLNADILHDLVVDWATDDFSEDNYEEEASTLLNLLKTYVDYKAINENLPKLWYPVGKEITLYKEDIEKYL